MTKTTTAAQGTQAKALTLPAFSNLHKAKEDLSSDTTMVILPDPVGHHMLIALPTIEQKTKSGLIIPTTVTERERAATVVGYVIAMGDQCYKDASRFGVPEPDHMGQTRMVARPWCKTGDTVLFSRYSGMRFMSQDAETGEMVEYRMLADDQIVGTVPEGSKVGAL